MTDSHRNLIVTTALETIPPELRMQYKPAFVKLLWANAIQLLEDVWDRQVTQKLKYGVKIWKKKNETTKKNSTHSKINTIAMLVAYQSSNERNTRKKRIKKAT